MKLFWRDQCALLVFYSIQVVLIPVLYWLTGENRPWSIVWYGVLLSTVVLCLYLLYRYSRHRKLYHCLEEQQGMQEPDRPLDESPLSEAVYALLGRYDRHYKMNMKHQQMGNEQHLVFMNRWVHQMKTPVSVIHLLVQEIEDEQADSIQEELDRISKGLEMVLYTARLGSFEYDLSIESVSLPQLINEVVAGNRKMFIRKGITPIFDIQDELQIYSDAKWLRFALNQIMVNALKYTEGSSKQITISLIVQADTYKLSITDQGVGIASEDMKRVFDPYFTGGRGRVNNESTGMGLYLVKEVCRRLEHRVELQSELGMGTSVTLWFQHR